jgi:dihydroflavonol-4-reductase
MVLITGAAGHLGTALVRELAERGEKMRVFVLPQEDTGSLDGIALEVVRGDVRDAALVRSALRGIDTVYHLAGLISIMPGRDELMRQVNIGGTTNVACQAREAGVRRMVFVSSIHALARPPEGRAIDETVPFDSTSPAGEYDRTKAEASLSVLAEVKKGLDAVIVCPTGIIGPYHTRAGSPMLGLMRRWMRPGGHVVVNGYFDFVDARDVARGLVLAAENGIRGETYIIRGERVSMPTLLQLVRQSSGHRGPDIIAPFRLALLGAALATLHSRLWKTRVGFTRYALETLVSNSVVSGEKARRELGYRARPLRETVRDTVLWLSGNPAQRPCRQEVSPLRQKLIPRRIRFG